MIKFAIKTEDGKYYMHGNGESPQHYTDDIDKACVYLDESDARCACFCDEYVVLVEVTTVEAEIDEKCYELERGVYDGDN